MMAPSLATRIVAWSVYAFMLTPLVVIILLSFGERSYFELPPSDFSIKWYVRAWESGTFLMPAIRSLSLGVSATVVSAIMALGAGMGMRSMRSQRSIWLLELVFLSPLIVPHLILGIALLHFFSPIGLIDTYVGLLAAHVTLVFPFLFRTVLVSIQNLNPRLEEASELLGASPLMTFRLVVFPALIPGIVAGAILGLIVSFDQFTVSLLVTQREQVTLPVAIYKYLYDTNDPVVAAVSTVLVIVGFSLTLALQRLGRFGRSLPG